MTDAKPRLFLAELPASWPESPPLVSFSLLKEVEGCPRQAGLRHAMYPQIWGHRGYPPKLLVRAVFGQVVHATVQAVCQLLASGGSCGISDMRTPAILKEAGGLSSVIQQTIVRVLKQHADNPRYDIQVLSQRLLALIPEVRQSAQTMLARVVSFLPQPSAPHMGQQRQRWPLSIGCHFEVEVSSKKAQWKGFIDCIQLSEQECQLTDFKTGAPESSHVDQLRAYAVLWVDDVDLNPTARRATKLTLSYPNRSINVELPSERELDLLRSEMSARANHAKLALAARPPVAVPSAEQCKMCEVRQLCAEYWTSRIQKMLYPDIIASTRYCDAEVILRSRRSDRTWEATFTTANAVPEGSSGLVQLSEVVAGKLKDHIGPGVTLRLLDAYAAVAPESSGVVLVNMNQASEAFVVPPES